MANKDSDDLIGAALKRMDELTPKEGFNLVGVDPLGHPGEELYLIDHFDARGDATRALAAKKAADPGGTFYIYGPKGR